MQKINRVEDIKEIVTGFHTLKRIEDNKFELELEILINTNEFISLNAKPIIQNKVFLLVCD